jgi:hypothetical protein
MRASLVEVLEAVSPQDALEMTLAKHDDVIEALATNTPEKPFAAAAAGPRAAREGPGSRPRGTR